MIYVWCGGGHVCLSACMKTRGQAGGVSSLLLLLHRFQGLKCWSSDLHHYAASAFIHWAVFYPLSSSFVTTDELTHIHTESTACILFEDLFSLFSVCAYVCVCVFVCVTHMLVQMPTEARRPPEAGIAGCCELCDIGARNQPQVLCKRIKCS